MRLSIVIPALNEEAAIADIIKRTLAARTHIVEHSPVRHVDIIVVNDGSTDRTAAIAAEYADRGDIALIHFAENRGYGAAIKAGFERSRGQIVGFLDADGTCDPRFFATLCSALVEEDADVAIGSRLHRDSRMPRVRRLGNRLYAAILGLLSNRCVTDTASGMRVIRRDVLPRLYPLPDRLDFTPAMSARVLMDDALRIIERPMPYQERVGRSKLSVLRDGMRFLQTIGHMALVWNPGRVFGLGAAACFLVMILLALHPIEAWLRAGRFGEDTIYRLMFCLWLGCVGGALLSANVVTRTLRSWLDHIRGSGNMAASGSNASYVGHMLDRLYTLRGVALLSAASLIPLVWLIGSGVWTWMTEGRVSIHWSRVVLAGLIAFNLVQMLTATLVVNVIRFHARRTATSAVAETSAAQREVGHPSFPEPAPETPMMEPV